MRYATLEELNTGNEVILPLTVNSGITWIIDLIQQDTRTIHVHMAMNKGLIRSWYMSQMSKIILITKDWDN